MKLWAKGASEKQRKCSFSNLRNLMRRREEFAILKMSVYRVPWEAALASWKGKMQIPSISPISIYIAKALPDFWQRTIVGTFTSAYRQPLLDLLTYYRLALSAWRTVVYSFPTLDISVLTTFIRNSRSSGSISRCHWCNIHHGVVPWAACD